MSSFVVSFKLLVLSLIKLIGSLFSNSVISSVISLRLFKISSNKDLWKNCGVVIEYNPDNDYLILGVIHPEKYAIAPTFSRRGCFYRLVTERERREWCTV